MYRGSHKLQICWCRELCSLPPDKRLCYLIAVGMFGTAVIYRPRMLHERTSC
jgi:hypothetical protein